MYKALKDGWYLFPLVSILGFIVGFGILMSYQNKPNYKVNDCLVIYPSFKSAQDLESWEVGKANSVVQIKAVGKKHYLVTETRKNLITGQLASEDISYTIPFVNHHMGSNLKNCSEALTLL